jgi:hypothetical protein
MADDGTALAAAEATMARFVDAGQRLDLPEFLETLAPSVRLRSPISSRARFEGFDEVAALLEEVFDLLSDVEYLEDVGTSTTRGVFFSARIGDQTVESAILVRLDERARVTEMTMFFRPLPGLTELTARLAPRLAGRRGRFRAFAIAAMTWPMAVLTSRVDALGIRLVQPRRR